MISRRGFLTGAGGVSMMGLLAACSSSGGASTALSAKATQTLVMLNYSGWMGKNTVSAFQKQSPKVKITQKDLPSGGGGGIQTLIKQNPGSYDFALLGNGSAKSVNNAKILNDFDAAKVPNLSNIPDKFQKAFPWGMPLEQGKVGIIYRKDLIDSPPTSWKQLFDQMSGSLSGKVLLPNYDADVFSIALLALGHDINTASTTKVDAAADLVINAKPDIKAFVDSDRIKSLKSGAATVAVGYDYDTAGVLGVDDTIGWIAPSEGTPAYLDGWVMFDQSEHQAAVYSFMDFILEPANYADFINNTGASYLMPTAESKISKDITGNEALALDLSLNVVYEQYVSGEVQAYRDNLWEKIQAA
jgi:spermidine/putrescine transport system substrate-binding protein